MSKFPRSVAFCSWGSALSSFAQHSWIERNVSAREQYTHIRVIVAEPDPTSRRLICSLLENQPDVLMECIDNSDLLSKIQEVEPDLVILDVKTNAIKGTTSWEALGVKSPSATILTSYDTSSRESFASAEAHLLIKPFSVEQFENAVQVARATIRRLRNPSQPREQNGNQYSRPERRQFLHRLAVESEGKIVLLKVQDILWIQSFGNHIRLHSAGTTHMLRQTMKNLQDLLDPMHFLRVHRNAIVNLDHVLEFYLPRTGNMFVKLDNGMSLPLRRANRTFLRKRLRQDLLV
jgi:two-component system, LytTR family, response regulator